MPNTVFYDADYRRMNTVNHDFGKAIPVPPGAMFVCQWLTIVPEDQWTTRKVNTEGDGNGNG